MKLLYKYHDRLALIYSEKCYALGNSHKFYSFYEAKFKYHIFMSDWYYSMIKNN